MKKLLIFFCLVICFQLTAQQTEGTIYYTESVKFNIELPEGQEHLKDMIPSSNDQTKALYFTPQLSMYKDLDGSDGVTEINQESEGTQMQVKIVAGSSDNKLLKDFEKKEVIDQREFMGKNFLIQGDFKEITWKMTSEQKKILKFVCQKATFQKEDQTITAWFTSQIPLSNGPDVYGQLPGMILEISSDEGDRTITATKVEFGSFDQSLLEKPKKGKKVSREEFHKIQNKKMKEMGGERGRTVIRMEIDDRG